jgi:hypothetical protein
MNFLKKALVVVALMAGGTAYAQNTINNEQVNVIINGLTSREELAIISQQLRPLGIDFKYHPTFTNERKLNGISYKLLFTGSTALLAENEISNLQMSNAALQFKFAKQDGHWVLLCSGNCD